MPGWSEQQKQEVRDATVKVVLAIRSAYLDSGASILTHWDQLQDRMRAAARTTASVEEWYTALVRSLQLATLTKASSSSVVELVALVGDNRRSFLDLIEAEFGYMIARARVTLERRRAEYQGSPA
mgnify:CR=1 FL=1